MATMRAAVFERNGKIAIHEVPRPEPGVGSLTRASALSRLDRAMQCRCHPLMRIHKRIVCSSVAGLAILRRRAVRQ